MDYKSCLKTTGLVDDLRKMDEYVNMYSHSVHHTEAMPMEQYLESWFEAKDKYLLDLFDGELVLERPVSFPMPRPQLDKAISDMVHTSEWEEFAKGIILILQTMVFNSRDFESLPISVKLDYNNPERAFYLQVSHLMYNTYALAENKLSTTIDLRPSTDNLFPKEVRFNGGAKPFKCLRNLLRIAEPVCREENPTAFTDDFWTRMYDLFEQCRILHSQILNTKKLKGTLCLSIHPLDYITMSDNDYNWHSCMRWTGRAGEYRTGTIEMMNSDCVVVAYLKGSVDWYPCNSDWTWSNKKWRQLFIVHKNILAGIKGYPYCSDALTSITLEWLKDICEMHDFNSYETGVKDTAEEGCKVGDFSVEFGTCAMYNDTDCNDFLYIPVEKKSICPDEWIVSHNGFFGDSEVRTINYSGVAYCMKCGEPLGLNADCDDCDVIFCEDCDEVPTCCDCGRHINIADDPYLEYDGRYYCEDCYASCDVCGGPTTPSNDVRTSLAFVSRAWNRWNHHDVNYLYLCPTCVATAVDTGAKTINVHDREEVSHLWSQELLVALPTLDENILRVARDTFDFDDDPFAEELVDFSVE